MVYNVFPYCSTLGCGVLSNLKEVSAPFKQVSFSASVLTGVQTASATDASCNIAVENNTPTGLVIGPSGSPYMVQGNSAATWQVFQSMLIPVTSSDLMATFQANVFSKLPASDRDLHAAAIESYPSGFTHRITYVLYGRSPDGSLKASMFQLDNTLTQYRRGLLDASGGGYTTAGTSCYLILICSAGRCGYVCG
eukprot:TRINITY_DN569_c0_g1_i1.p1 TRINITY_DN569_c0_g1~~TRINITY_DN569_c0_g1_i1.p1  ORF type:complete len:194 (+),score=7.76 TRINITY_DN569_c0_g1_i1:2011-2592(+)